MTIDERLDKLAERHEALSQTVELLARQVQGLERTAEYMLREMHDTFAATNAGINNLLTIVQSHEARLSKLEG
jgi:CII-binding regulator of phage lambda lysogenization HflD